MTHCICLYFHRMGAFNQNAVRLHISTSMLSSPIKGHLYLKDSLCSASFIQPSFEGCIRCMKMNPHWAWLISLCKASQKDAVFNLRITLLCKKRINNLLIQFVKNSDTFRNDSCILNDTKHLFYALYSTVCVWIIHD